MLSAGLRNPTKFPLDLGDHADCSSSEDERVPLLQRGASSIPSDGASGPRLRQRQRTSLYRNMPALVQREWGELMGETVCTHRLRTHRSRLANPPHLHAQIRGIMGYCRCRLTPAANAGVAGHGRAYQYT